MIKQKKKVVKKKVVKPVEKMPAPIIDTREQIPFIFSLDYFNEPISRKLDTGDYSLEGYEHILSIERKKSATEIAGNMCEKRFSDCLDRLQSMPVGVIVCEFRFEEILNFPYGSELSASLKRRLRRISGFWMTSFFSDIMVHRKIPVVFAGTTERAQRFTINIMKSTVKKYGQKISQVI